MIGVKYTAGSCVCPPPTKKSLFMRMAGCVFANVVVIMMAGKLYRLVRRIASIGRRGTPIATTTAGVIATTRSYTSATFVEIEPDAYQSNAEKIDDTLL